jgi:SAM-dependent methyltransferase
MGISINSFLKIKTIRIIICKLRFFYFTKFRKAIKVLDSKDSINFTISHNLKGLYYFGLDRMDKLIKPLSVLENLNCDSRILVIGPRNEEDIFNLMGNGFNNIIGLDLISYSPYIQIGDMHNTNFMNDTFDAIICGWTLSYSDNPIKFANEMIRIIKNKGVLAIGIEYSTLNALENFQVHNGYTLENVNIKRINSVNEILSLFTNYLGDIFFIHDAPNKISHSSELVDHVSSVATIFSIIK